ncbi:unnamed protein product [Brassicogethes aeneus]|uniref:mRNA-decapping enzyme 2 n=1 Tax=Brassicogethes aeneus TaxID=1431903 RepID=A0A9P0AQY3_BRAAE|nr:unnamed protein product [Brassicogethes aeneus]
MLQAKIRLLSLRAVNDTAERAVKLMQDFHGLITAKESVQEHRNLEKKFFIPCAVMDYLTEQFIFTLPENNRKNINKVCDQVELAHWHYLDECVAKNSRLKTCRFFDFALQIFNHVHFLQEVRKDLHAILKAWIKSRMSIPTYGGIILSRSRSHVLLVQSYWRKTWSFPRGKVLDGEDPVKGATREIFEETGFNASSYIFKDKYCELIKEDNVLRLYYIDNVPFNTKFRPGNKFEVCNCRWFKINDIPRHEEDFEAGNRIGFRPETFKMVFPFVEKLKQLSKWR